LPLSVGDGPLLFGFPADYSDYESPMIGMSRSPIVTGVVLGGLFMYCLHGAIVGDLAIHLRNGPDVHLHGLAAWLVTLAPVLIAAALSLRGGLIARRIASSVEPWPPPTSATVWKAEKS
jgi:hypothetical protein